MWVGGDSFYCPRCLPPVLCIIIGRTHAEGILVLLLLLLQLLLLLTTCRVCKCPNFLGYRGAGGTPFVGGVFDGWAKAIDNFNKVCANECVIRVEVPVPGAVSPQLRETSRSSFFVQSTVEVAVDGRSVTVYGSLIVIVIFLSMSSSHSQIY